MNDFVFTTYPTSFIPGHAFIDYNEIANGLERIHLIENFDVLRKQFDLFGLSPKIPNYEKYKTYDDYVEDLIEDGISHETLHRVLFHVGGLEAAKSLHNVDSWGHLQSCE